MRVWMLGLGLMLWAAAAVAEITLSGDLVQGGLVQGRALPGSTVSLDGAPVRVSPEGVFILGFHRDAPKSAVLQITAPNGAVDRRTLAVAARAYDIQRIDGLPPKMVTPAPETLARIRREGAEIKAARSQDRPVTDFLSGFIWPAKGRISGVYGSQRILNGEPRRPHFGVDVAAPVGTPVVAPADGVVTLAVTDHYYTGGTIILDHGHGLSSAFLHMNTVTVKPGDRLRQGDPMGTIGATGRVTGPHLDWRMNWFDKRLDPALLVPPMPRG
ncbi:MAG: M23 family metallopeptidase [Alphaproteobacteria bacterium]|nr:M23 family metallopeptidase [Alphaproteobacteria bacterium]